MNLQFRPANAPPPPIPTHLILASQSIGRRSLMEKLGFPFRIAISRIDEDAITDPNPVKMIQKRAKAKAEEVVTHPRIYTIDEKAKSLIIAADSMAIVGKKTYGKATDRENAKEMLKSLMGRTHEFTTAVSIVLLEGIEVKKRWDKTVTTKVTLRKMTSPEIDSYVTRYDFSRFAAGYALNETPWDLVTKVDGSYTNVIGLPFEVLLPVLRQLKILI